MDVGGSAGAQSHGTRWELYTQCTTSVPGPTTRSLSGKRELRRGSRGARGGEQPDPGRSEQTRTSDPPRPSHRGVLTISRRHADYEARHAPLQPRNAYRELKSHSRLDSASWRCTHYKSQEVVRRPVRLCAWPAPPPFVLPAAPAGRLRPLPWPPARVPDPWLPISMAKRLAFSRLRKISSGGSVMLLSRLSPPLPPPLAPRSAILKVPGQPHQPWRYMRI